MTGDGQGSDKVACWLDGVRRVQPWAWSLACRRSRVLSQRELAAAAGLSHGTVERIESGQGRPAYDTVVRLLAAGGYELAAVDSLGGLLDPASVEVVPRDRSGRRLPVHLDPARTRPLGGPRPGDYTPYGPPGWWGWFRVAWWESDPAVPLYTYQRR